MFEKLKDWAISI